MADLLSLSQALAEFAEALQDEYRVGDVLDNLGFHARHVVGVAGAGVSLEDDGTLRFVTATDDRTHRVEMAQEGLREGPCYDAFLNSQPVAAEDLRREESWPEYTPVAVGVGFLAAAGIPMRAGSRIIGALNLYHDQPREWDLSSLAAAQVLADVATAYVVHNRKNQQSRELARQLQHALDSRIVIEQAKGILAERHGTGTNEAFKAIRQYSRDHNRRVHDIAQEIVEGRSVPRA